MKILMVSPHPTYSPRGTPISVLNRCRALSALGHEIDLVTYGIGQDVPVPGLRYLRAPVPGISSVRVGPSAAKLPLDVAVFGKALRRMSAGRGNYDVLHTHEEAGVLGLLQRKRSALPHVYDMGNDLAVVMRNYGFAARHPLTRLVAAGERSIASHADVVIAHFPSIADKVAAVTGGRVLAHVVPNIALEPPADVEHARQLRERWNPDDLPLVVYTGTLETYQGLPLLIGALSALRTRHLPVRLLVVGGREEQRRELALLAAERGVADLVSLVGVVPQDEVPSYLLAGDILVSPRAGGSNTPLKIFSYLRSGRPILATRIVSHTQVLDDTTAMLVTADEPGLAAGLRTLIEDRPQADRLARRAGALAAEAYDRRAFVRGVAAAYAVVGADAAGDEDLDRAVAQLDGKPTVAVRP